MPEWQSPQAAACQKAITTVECTEAHATAQKECSMPEWQPLQAAACQKAITAVECTEAHATAQK